MGSRYIAVAWLACLLACKEERFRLDTLPFDQEFRKPLAGQKIDIENASDSKWVVGKFESEHLKACIDFLAAEQIAGRVVMRDCSAEREMAMAAVKPEEIMRRIRHTAKAFRRVSDDKCCEVVPIK